MIIASFPKGSYPEYTWPIGTWPEAPEAAVDIVYTEVFEFSLAIATTAGFSVVLPNNASINAADTSTMIVSGAGTTAANGTYIYSGTGNSKPYYLFGDYRIGWQTSLSSFWYLKASADVVAAPRYYSFDDVATPDLVTTWEQGIGDLPVPTVAIGTPTPTLTEVAPFTVEMPITIAMEVYEELSK